MNGVSIIICCHNSADKLSQTIQHVNFLKVPSHILWEVIVVDNASSDNTSAVAASLLSVELKRITRIVSENELGLRNARLRGIAESQYDFISFIDDDNWICPEWVQLCYEVLSKDLLIGACGGEGEAEFDNCIPPFWFKEYEENFAVGKQGEHPGDVTDSRGYLWGAGLTIRREAWNQLYSQGFNFALTGRKGTCLSSGEDAELCFALRLAGWKLYYEPRMTFKHLMTAQRLQWDYLRRLKRSFGRTAVIHKAYSNMYNDSIELGMIYLLKQLLSVLVKFIANYIKYVNKKEGSNDELTLEYLTGYLCELLKSIFFFPITVTKFNIIKRIATIKG